MNKATTTATMAMWALVALGGCGGAGGNSPGAGDPGGGGGAGAATGPASSSDDTAVCQRACSTLIGCGVEYDATCVAGCLQTPVFVDCARTATDCNGLALCAFRAGSAAACGSATAGYPSGAQGCGAAATCQGVCDAASQPAACQCACNAALAAGNAINLLINDQCAVARCPVECGASGSGPACLTCFQASCQTESAQCTAAPVSTGTGTPGGASPGQAPLGLPAQPTAEAAPVGTLDPQLVGSWPVTGVQVYWDASGGVIDSSASAPLQAQLASVPLLLAADGTFSFGTVAGTWSVIPFIAADKALWGTGGMGPDGYAREIVLAVGGQQYMRGPIEDPSPPATAPWGLRFSFRVASPQAGTVMLFLDRPTTTTGGGAKK